MRGRFANRVGYDLKCCGRSLNVREIGICWDDDKKRRRQFCRGARKTLKVDRIKYPLNDTVILSFEPNDQAQARRTNGSRPQPALPGAIGSVCFFLVPLLPSRKRPSPLAGRLSKQYVLDADIFVKFWPVNTVPGSNQLPNSAVFRQPVGKTRVPGNGNPHDSPVG